LESPKEGDHSGDQGIDGRMGSDWISEIGWERVNWIRLAQDGLVVSCCECGDEPSGSCTMELVVIQHMEGMCMYCVYTMYARVSLTTVKDSNEGKNFLAGGM
jgi:hypothetical protein